MTLRDPGDIGRLLAWAAQPREVPSRHDDYSRVVSRYRNEPDFAAAADAVLSGAGLNIEVDERDGVIVTANSDSPLRATLSDVMKRAQSHHRAVIGAAVLGVARTAYPEPAMVDDPNWSAVFTTDAVVATLDRAAQAHAEASDTDGPADGDLVEVWRRWLEVAQARPNQERVSSKTRPGVVHKVCKLLVDAGYLNERSTVDGGTWVARPRFRHAVATLTEDSDLYLQINDLTSTGPATSKGPDEGSGS